MREAHKPLQVLLTVDTEFWPEEGELTEGSVEYAYSRDLLGGEGGSVYGLSGQFEILRRYQLRGSFFVEALCGHVFGRQYLQRMVDMVLEAGHEIQLHIHPEWNHRMEDPLIPGKCSAFLYDYTKDEQKRMLEAGLENLARCGVSDVNAFRAGNYGANWETLEALHELGIPYDTSYNWSRLGETCEMFSETPYLHPFQRNGVVEIPVSFFRSFLSEDRHAQLCACSFAEMSDALFNAWKHNWETFTIVSHSFELLEPGRRKGDTIVRERFEQLCAFLAKHADKFEVVGFRDLKLRSFERKPKQSRPISVRRRSTARRHAEQLMRRFLGHF